MDRFGDEWCREADWFRVQEGADLAQLAVAPKGHPKEPPK